MKATLIFFGTLAALSFLGKFFLGRMKNSSTKSPIEEPPDNTGTFIGSAGPQ